MTPLRDSHWFSIHPHTRRRVLELTARLATAFLMVIGITALGSSTPVHAASDTDVRWENFSEASACGEPYTQTPYVSKTGFLANSEQILGPFGTYFGRSIADVRSTLVTWDVPFSGGKRVKVSRSALPAFQRVTAGLMTAAAAGHIYPITNVGAFTPRTIDNSRQLSRHGLGLAIDINPAQNPYRADGKLITNFPTWFVDVWRDAGFCWGGDWVNAKDTMHFSWMGPRAPPNANDPLHIVAPSTALRDFGPVAAKTTTIFSPVLSRYVFAVADGTGDGAPDVVGVRPHPDGAVIDISTGSGSYGACSIERWFVPTSTVASADRLLFMDVDRDSRQDLVSLTKSGATLTAVVTTRRGGYDDVKETTTAVPSDSVIAGADFDGDHVGDIWAATPDGRIRVFSGSGWTQPIEDLSLPDGQPALLAAGDRDGGDRPELFAIYPSGTGSRLEVLKRGSAWEIDQSVQLPTKTSDLMAIGPVDYDGDGRADIELFDSSGDMSVYLGNSPTGKAAGAWFRDPSPCGSDPIPLNFDGTFYDDDRSVHQRGIEAIATAGITQSCNPPYKDKFCPESTLTRAQAATFVARALGLPATDVDHFTDDDGHLLEGGINRLADAGITTGCNPPANTHFCPDRGLTRAEFAAFIARALTLPPSTTDYFTDDNGNVLEGAVNRLAAAGITTGCNPPVNDKFCPSRILTRAETATFLTRALKLP